ncbi:NAD(P)/FAD-dependent oxidoreductase [Streptomyces sp. WAC07149]|uniref:FAD-dependent oxidoreductase n=1 Tax=Streptomyces sp. WAC07149 TaxID=2487425 RepID=UPI00163D2458|nr:FAD-dependent monooxygenase [Streptomyces sp. WAC07149]
MAESRAVVVGGSVAGLLTAAALTEAFDEVVVLERDVLPEGEDFRAGVPQARQFHGLLMRGAQSIEKLLPGILQELAADGAPLFDLGERFQLSVHGRVVPPRTFGLRAQLFTRNFLETRLRTRVRALPGVVFRENSPVTGLLADRTGGPVTGVRIAHGGDFAEELPAADLVVDASGRNSQATAWLGALGYPAPEELRVDSGRSYATAWVGAPQELGFTGALYEIGQHVTRGRGGLVAALQNQQVLLMLYGRGSDRPPTDPDGFRERVDQLGSPVMSELAAHISSNRPIHPYAKLINRRKLYHRMPRWPDRFLVLGDALCVFNPIYGQGMTVAAMQAETLRDSVRYLHHSADWTRTTQRRIHRRTTIPWLLATTQDSRWTERPSVLSPAVASLMERVMSRVGQSPQLHRALLQIYQLLPPTALCDPRGVLAVCRPDQPRAARAWFRPGAAVRMSRRRAGIRR